jgi:hypothetical protein
MNKIIDILKLLIQEQEGSDPRNPDVYPDQDEWGFDDAWTWDEWKIYYESIKKKHGEVTAKKIFLKYWEVVEAGTGVVADNDMDPLWFKQKEMWNGKQNRPYTRKEFEDTIKYNEFVKTQPKVVNKASSDANKQNLSSNVNKNDLQSVIACSGYGAGTPEFKLAIIMATKEGWIKDSNQGKGSRSYRNNNPGNLDYYDGLKLIDSKVKKGTKLDGSIDRFAKFSSPCLGAKALIEEKILKWSRGNMPVYGSAPGYRAGKIPTLKQFVYTYAPPKENDSDMYIDFIKNSLGDCYGSGKVYGL